MDFFSDILKERGWKSRSIGVEIEGYYFTAEVLCVLQQNLSEVFIKDGTLVGNLVRRIKSTAEIACIGQADRIAENVMGTVLNQEQEKGSIILLKLACASILCGDSDEEFRFRVQRTPCCN